MVAEKKEAVGVESMAMGSGRSKPPLHNFTLPYGLKWGNQKFLRCGKLDSDGEIAPVHRRPSSEQLIGKRRSSSEAGSGLPRRGSDERVGIGNFRADVEDGIAAVRKKLMNDLQAETDKMKDAILRTGLEDEMEEEELRPAAEQRSPPPTTVPAVAPPSETTTDAADSARRWNLRARRSGTKHPNGFSAVSGESNPGLKVDVTIPNAFPPVKSENKSPRLRSISAAAAAGGGGGVATVAGSSRGEKRERAKFSIALSRREIEEDFAAIVHHRPPRRSKKRAKYIQKNLDNLFPGLWLTEITPDLYKVPEDQ